MLFKWLQEWYISVLDNKTNSSTRIKIDTMDNPGWIMYIDLSNTEHEYCNVEKMSITRSKNDWIVLHITDNIFTIYSGPQNLEEIISIFKHFITYKEVCLQDARYTRNDKLIKWLEDWFLFNCDGDWEHSYGINIYVTDDYNWHVQMDLCNMVFSLKGLPLKVIKNTSNNILNYIIDDEDFVGNASPTNLVKLLKISRKIIRKNESKGYYKEFYDMKEFTRLQNEYSSFFE